VSDPTPTPVPAPTPSGDDNATIRAMRAQIDAATQAAKDAEEQRKALETKLTELERRDMDEKQRLSAELEDAKKAAADAEKLRNEHGQFVSAFESIYNNRLASVPDEHRSTVEKFSKNGDWQARIEAIDAAMAMLKITPAPVAAGTITQPGGGTPPPTPPETPQPAKPLTPQELRSMSLKSIIEERRKTTQP
jgi:hypothetical protein